MRRGPSSPPPRPRATVAAVSAALSAGDTDGAGRLADALLALEPQNPDALHLGGRVALALKRPSVAIDRLRRAAVQRPRDAALIADFGRALEAAGRRGEAEQALRAAMALNPGGTAHAVALAELLVRAARDDEAAELFRDVVRREPGNAAAHARLAQLELGLMLPREAIASAERALGLDRDNTVALAALGSAFDTVGRYDEAVTLRQRSIALAPQSGGRRYDLGMTHLHHGRLGEAEAAFRDAIRLEPGNGNWHQALAFVVKHRGRDGDIAAMEALLRTNSASNDDRMLAGFGLGKALDDIGAYDEAFSAFLEANRLKRAKLNYSTAETDKLFDALKGAFTAELFSARPDAGSPDPTPIFVLGMPRSGTSLVEQVLASHPDVAGGGEFRIVNQLLGTIAGGAGFPIREALQNTSDAQLRTLGETYVRRVRALSGDARFITDKLPGNFIVIGFIKLILPHAKVVHVRRDPLDTCLSLFKNYFAAEHLRYAYDLTEIGAYYRRYADLMAHWHQVLPGFIHDVGYEDLVADFEGEAKRLYAFCGLDWREEARQFFNTPRSVQTASAVQVRQPLYSTSIGQAERYGDRLQPLLDALGGR